MSVETMRRTFGASDKGQVTLITKAVEDDILEEGKPTVQRTKDVFIVREGGRTIIETEDEATAIAFAESLGSVGGIVAPGVDERRMGEVGAIAPHEHRIATHEVRPESETHKLAADEPNRLSPGGPIAQVNPAIDEQPRASTRSPKAADQVDETATGVADDADKGKADVGDEPRNAREAAAEGKLGSTEGNATGTPVAESGSSRRVRS